MKWLILFGRVFWYKKCSDFVSCPFKFIWFLIKKLVFLYFVLRSWILIKFSKCFIIFVDKWSVKINFQKPAKIGNILNPGIRFNGLIFFSSEESEIQPSTKVKYSLVRKNSDARRWPNVNNTQLAEEIELSPIASLVLITQWNSNH